MANILVELFNLSLDRGTGISTYANMLTETVAGLGHDVSGLLHTRSRLRGSSAEKRELSVFDARPRGFSRYGRALRSAASAAVGAPFGINAFELPQARRQIDSAAWSSSYGDLKSVCAATAYEARARDHFRRYGSSARINAPKTPDIFHVTHALPVHIHGAKNIYTIHDLVPLRLPFATLDDKSYFLDVVRYIGRTAAKIVTVSEASRRDIIELAGVDPDKVYNTYQSVSFPESFTALSEDEVASMIASAFNLRYKDYFLFYGAIEPKKNIGRMIDAYLASGSSSRLVLAGGLGWLYDNDVRKIRENRSRSYIIKDNRIEEDVRIRRLPYLPRFQLVNLIRGARCVLFPSLYEGFGLPVLEAMLLGTPVVTSNNSSLVEVAGDAALLVDPFNVPEMVRAIRVADSQPEVREELIAKGRKQAARFSPAAYAERVKRLYENVMASDRSDP